MLYLKIQNPLKVLLPLQDIFALIMFKSDVVWSLLSAFLLKGVVSQEVGKEQYERKPNITWQSCTSKDECAVKKGQITLDANWRWLHDKGGYVGRTLVHRRKSDHCSGIRTVFMTTPGIHVSAQPIRSAPKNARLRVQITKALMASPPMPADWICGI